MIVGIGVDMAESKRIFQTYRRFGDRFLNKILTAEELRKFDSDERVAAYVSKQFAAKEAVAKALGTGMKQGVSFRTIKVLRKPSGQPYVELVDGAAEVAKVNKVSVVHISLSDERDYAVAYAIAESLD